MRIIFTRAIYIFCITGSKNQQEWPLKRVVEAVRMSQLHIKIDNFVEWEISIYNLSIIGVNVTGRESLPLTSELITTRLNGNAEIILKIALVLSEMQFLPCR